MRHHQINPKTGRPRWLTARRFDRLGKVPDTVIAGEAGVAVTTVRRWRRRLGIRAWCPGQTLTLGKRRR